MTSKACLLAPVSVRFMIVSLVKTMIIAVLSVCKLLELSNHWTADALTLSTLSFMRILLGGFGHAGRRVMHRGVVTANLAALAGTGRLEVEELFLLETIVFQTWALLPCRVFRREV